MKLFVILPHQLFNKKYLTKYKSTHQFLIWEHPHYFKKYTYNKKKLMLHRASMKYYHDYLKFANFNVKYFSIKDNKKILAKLRVAKLAPYSIFDPIDKLDLLGLVGKYEIIESPNFLLGRKDYAKYRGRSSKFFFNAFYMWGKGVIGVIPKIKSQDKNNRRKLPAGIKLPKLPSNENKVADSEAYLKEAARYVAREFPNNYGNVGIEDFQFPITHAVAKRWLKDFINKRFKKFGDYQDAIHDREHTLFHSVLSTSINIGLLNPTDIIQEIMKTEVKKKIPMNSYEGYVRQLFWREYQRYCYIYMNKGDWNKNYFSNRRKLSKKWYSGEVGVLPVDNCIKAAFNDGYLNHIERLMVMGNFMNLSGISPREGFRWFMEFACDSYEWVMHQNVLEMVFFVTGGMTMRRPYVSSSNYILKMSNYKKGKKWTKKWDELYRAFLKKNRKKLWKFRYYFRGLTTTTT